MPVALLSVYNKKSIAGFARELVALDWDILASGGTARALEVAQVPVRDVADLVGGEAILGHRVVTLSREVHAGLQARAEDKAQMNALNLPYIDLVCVDLYPLEGAINAPDHSLAKIIEMTDIGGPTMLRSGAKGNRIVICDPADRKIVVSWLKDGQPNRDAFINTLAAKAEAIVANYCLASARYRSNGAFDGFVSQKFTDCRYGENPWQTPAGFYAMDTTDPLALSRFIPLLDSIPSSTNLCDFDRLLHTLTHLAATFDVNRHYQPLMGVACKHGIISIMF